MVLLEEYYELEESENVSYKWKAMQISVYVCAAFFGIWTGFAMALLRFAFDDKCHLFAKVVFEQAQDNSLHFHNMKSLWGPDSLCEFCQYSMISSFIVATIWATFFLMCGPGGKSVTGLPQPWRIVVPSLGFNLIYLIIAFTAAVKIQQGSAEFCDEYDAQALLFNVTGIGGDCAGLDVFSAYTNSNSRLHLDMTVRLAWVCVAAWFVAFLLPLVRIVLVTDFQMYKVSVFTIDDGEPNKDEKVVKVTEFEEPKSPDVRKVITQAQMHVVEPEDSSDYLVDSEEYSPRGKGPYSKLLDEDSSEKIEETINVINYEEPGSSRSAVSEQESGKPGGSGKGFRKSGVYEKGVQTVISNVPKRSKHTTFEEPISSKARGGILKKKKKTT